MQTEPASAAAVQQTLDAVVEHLAKAGEGARDRVFKNARFLNTSRRRTLARAAGLIPMTTLPVTYGYARVSKSDDEAGNLETQLRLLADHGIREDLVFSDIATGRTLRRACWQELMSRLRPGDTLAVAFLDRLSRNFEDGVRIQADLTERNIGIVALRENIDTSDGSAAAKFFRPPLRVDHQQALGLQLRHLQQPGGGGVAGPLRGPHPGQQRPAPPGQRQLPDHHRRGQLPANPVAQQGRQGTGYQRRLLPKIDPVFIPAKYR